MALLVDESRRSLLTNAQCVFCSGDMATPLRPSVVAKPPQTTSPLELNSNSRSKRPREPSDDDDVFVVETPVSVDRAASCSGAADSKFAKLRRIMEAARGII